MGRQHYIPGVLYGTGAKLTVKEEIATPGPAGALRHNKAYMLVVSWWVLNSDPISRSSLSRRSCDYHASLYIGAATMSD